MLPGMSRAVLCAASGIGALWLAGTAVAYPWPLAPFNRMHPIRAGFDDPRFHVGLESSLSAFHFGVDIAGRDGTRVYAVSPGYVHRFSDHVTVRRPATGRAYGYWHIDPAVRNGQHVKLHQFLGTIRKGWGHVHFAESVNGSYRNPLRRGALQPFRDKTAPTVASIGLVGPNGDTVNPASARGIVDVEADVYDTPPIPPPAPWNRARLAPALVMWQLSRDAVPLTGWNLSADFTFSLMPGPIYPYFYAPGTYQNKANRPGRYVFWITHGLDTTSLPNGSYRITVLAQDLRFNQGSLAFDFVVANPGPLTLTYVLRRPWGHAE
jgi:murein DD-endopeptidase MepM/ murein hydrolase activator NlpD